MKKKMQQLIDKILGRFRRRQECHVQNDVDSNLLAKTCTEQFTCPVCFELMVFPYSMVPCNHMFCAECLGEWFATKARYAADCPVCREKCKTTPPVRQFQSHVIITVVASTLGREDRRKWDQRMASFRSKREEICEALALKKWKKTRYKY